MRLFGLAACIFQGTEVSHGIDLQSDNSTLPNYKVHAMRNMDSTVDLMFETSLYTDPSMPFATP